MIIAIDGPSGSGKGTLGKRLAKEFNFAYLDTGLLYRAVGWTMLQKKYDLENEEAATEVALHLDIDHLNEEDLRRDEAAIAASKVSGFIKVRSALLDYQRNFSKTPPKNKPGAVLDGRDIGTAVCPEADLKLYLVADLESRATRRFKDLQNMGVSCTFSDVLQDMQARDKRDETRSINPLKPAEDAHIIDTSTQTIDDVFHMARDLILAKQ